MRTHTIFIVGLLAAGLAVCTAQVTPTPTAPDPMAPFARMVGGEWKVTSTSGQSAFDSWRWGPGKHSIRGGDLEVMYWHPGRKEVRLLSLHPEIPGIGRGSGEGTVWFEGETFSGRLILDQPPSSRKLATRWTFDGPDKYHDALLEDTGSGYKPLAEWDRARVPKRPESSPPAAAPKLPEHLKSFAALMGQWEASAGTPRLRLTVEFVPDFVDVRVRGAGETSLFEAYCYQQVRTGKLRCLALLDRGPDGAVYEGEVKVIDGGLELDLNGYEGDDATTLAVRIEIENGGTVRQRIWSGREPALVMDVRHMRAK